MTEYIKWTSENNVGFKLIDDQHYEMITLVNKLHQLLNSDDKKLKYDLLENLVIKLRTHFDDEENLMKKNKFTNFITHKLEHDRMMNKMITFKNEMKNGTKDINLELLKSLKIWFVNHNELNDIKLAKFLSELDDVQ